MEIVNTICNTSFRKLMALLSVNVILQTINVPSVLAFRKKSFVNKNKIYRVNVLVVATLAENL